MWRTPTVQEAKDELEEEWEGKTVERYKYRWPNRVADWAFALICILAVLNLMVWTVENLMSLFSSLGMV